MRITQSLDWSKRHTVFFTGFDIIASDVDYETFGLQGALLCHLSTRIHLRVELRFYFNPLPEVNQSMKWHVYSSSVAINGAQMLLPS